MRRGIHAAVDPAPAVPGAAAAVTGRIPVGLATRCAILWIDTLLRGRETPMRLTRLTAIIALFGMILTLTAPVLAGVG